MGRPLWKPGKGQTVGGRPEARHEAASALAPLRNKNWKKGRRAGGARFGGDLSRGKPEPTDGLDLGERKDGLSDEGVVQLPPMRNGGGNPSFGKKAVSRVLGGLNVRCAWGGEVLPRHRSGVVPAG